MKSFWVGVVFLFFNGFLCALAWAKTAAPIVVVMGGFKSCRPLTGQDGAPDEDFDPRSMRMAEAFRKVVSDLAVPFPNIHPKYILSCYAADFAQNALDFRIVSSEGAIAKIPVEDLLHSGEPMLENFNPVFDKLAEYVGTLMQAEPSSTLYLIGHSYGGWTALKLFLKIQPLYKNAIRALVTIDPISGLGCDMIKFGGGFLGEVAAGCRQAPADITHDQRLAIFQNLGPRVENYFQGRWRLLHSNAIPEFGAQQEDLSRELGSSDPIENNQHRMIATAGKPWRFLESVLQADLKNP